MSKINWERANGTNFLYAVIIFLLYDYVVTLVYVIVAIAPWIFPFLLNFKEYDLGERVRVLGRINVINAAILGLLTLTHEQPFASGFFIGCLVLIYAMVAGLLIGRQFFKETGTTTSTFSKEPLAQTQRSQPENH